MSDIPPGLAALLGGLIGVLGSCVAARWAYLAATVAAARKDRITRLQNGIADLMTALEVLSFSCRHKHKTPAEEIELYETARWKQSHLLVLIDPGQKAGDALIDAMEAAFGKLKTDPPPSKEDIAACMAAILAHGTTLVRHEEALLRKGR
jgi:hypothetical protein